MTSIIINKLPAPKKARAKKEDAAKKPAARKPAKKIIQADEAKMQELLNKQDELNWAIEAKEPINILDMAEAPAPISEDKPIIEEKPIIDASNPREAINSLSDEEIAALLIMKQKQEERGKKLKESEKAGYIRNSSIERPTKRVWHIADDLEAQGITERKEVIAACIKAGIATGTARTQFQAWKASKASH